MTTKISPKILLSALAIPLILGIVLYFTVLRVQNPEPVEEVPEAAGTGTTLNIMTFNILKDGNLGASTACLDDITRMIVDKQADIVGFQESIVARQSEDDGTTMDWDNYINDRLEQKGYGMARYFSSDGNIDSWRSRGNSLFIKKTIPVFEHHEKLYFPMPAGTSLNFQIAKIRLPEGDFYITNTHTSTQNNNENDLGCQQHTYMNTYMNQNYGTRPRIMIGDFNHNFLWNYSCGKYYLDNFVRACDPAVYPSCADTVVGTDANYAIDHIMLQKWNTQHQGTPAYWKVVKSEVLNTIRSNACSATVTTYETDFGDHFPVYSQVIVSNNPLTDLPDPTGLSRTCNTNGTTTFRWNAVSGAGEYGFRLDNQGTNPNSPILNWYSPPSDRVDKIAGTSITVPIIYGTYYQWAVTAVTTPGALHPLPTWQPAFTCTAPTATPTRTPTPTPTKTPIPTPTKTPIPTPTRTPTPRPTNTPVPTPITCIPTLTNPAANVAIATNPTFQWTSCGTGSKYQLIVKQGTLTTASVITSVTSYQFTNVPWQNNTTYTWTVKYCQ
ncbi:MAG: endonuclease/exonuclease/phosphatase family protein, partial [Candidatus Roizmanbacteria bacterium]|nr:endonuclease/exonuclease/phosphatase family protein [Candidatus Roizmanbacteria bacterium]